MRNAHGFDYNQPNRDALVGIYVEGSDLGSGTPTVELPASQEKPVVLAPVEQLFGITVSVDDDDRAAQPSRTHEA
jgi:hypothetical protein